MSAGTLPATAIAQSVDEWRLDAIILCGLVIMRVLKDIGARIVDPPQH